MLQRRETIVAALAALGLVALASACDQAPAPGPPLVMEALPGAEPLPAAAAQAIADVWRRRPQTGEPRTRHRREDGSPRYTNRLLLEPSPYLRQHAHNPVNWYPWGDEAFETARRLQRPVLLSIGYSTCHWCHVMEEESFEDEEIARFLNENYVAVKVDREQRPDLDSIYMTAVQAIAGSGGWPMTVWLTADREPFYGGTYFPPRDGSRGGRPGFLTVLAKLADAYKNDPQAVATNAAGLVERVRSALTPASAPADGLPGDEVLAAALAASLRRFDDVHGGARGARKFPSSLPLRALLRHHRRSGDPQALEIVKKTLDAMASGGIHDHLGGGFHRYSTDPAWLVPHFEKMLYDNALLTLAYVEAWQVTGQARFADVAREILDWVEREMLSPDGGFYSATDADSLAPDGTRTEGWFFTWTPAETAAVLGVDDARLFNAAYGVSEAGNLEGRSVLHRDAPHAVRGNETAATQSANGLARSRARLLAERDRRPRPLRDDKIVTSWNGLMISAAAKASLALREPRYRDLAAAAADSLMGDFDRHGRLARTTLDGHQQQRAFLDDYACLQAGLLDLYEAGDGDRRIVQAIALDTVLARDFEDPAGGFFMTAAGNDDLLVREKPLADGAEPSGNSVAIMNLLRLAELTGQAAFRDRAERALASLSPLLARNPLAASDALLAVDYAADTPKEIVLVTADAAETLEPLLRVVGSTFVPNRVVVTVTDEPPGSVAIPLAEDKIAIDGKPTAYVCEARVCELPTHDPDVLAGQLRRARPLHPADPAD